MTKDASVLTIRFSYLPESSQIETFISYRIEGELNEHKEFRLVQPEDVHLYISAVDQLAQGELQQAIIDKFKERFSQ